MRDRARFRVVFDVLTEDCLDEFLLNIWLSSGASYAVSMMPNQYVANYFCRRGLSLVGSFFIAMKPRITQYMVFTS